MNGILRNVGPVCDFLNWSVFWEWHVIRLDGGLVVWLFGDGHEDLSVEPFG